MTATPSRCKCRKQAITSLRCSRCSVLICPDCSKMYPVGMLCTGCARGTSSSRLTTLTPSNFAKTLIACLLVSIGMGWLLASLGGFGIMSIIWGGLFHGLAVSEAGLRVSGRKLGTQIEILVGSCIVIGPVVGWTLNALRLDVPVGEVLLAHLMNPYSWAMLIFAVVVGVGRFRTI